MENKNILLKKRNFVTIKFFRVCHNKIFILIYYCNFYIFYEKNNLGVFLIAIYISMIVNQQNSQNILK